MVNAGQIRAQSDYVIAIRNCNSIEEAVIQLRHGALNIKYGPNGIGKSTIARALTLRAADGDALDSLTPFKHKSSKNGMRPSVEGADAIGSVMTFNDVYVSNFVFRPDEVLKNSFEIFINTPEYRDGVTQIETQFESLKKTFADEPEFDAALEDFGDLRDTFNVTKGGALAKTSKAYKGLSVSSKLANIPEKLRGYEGFLQSDDPASWITWQAKGKEYLELSSNCPFCSTSSINKETAAEVSVEYNSSAVKNLSVLRGAIDRLGKYFSSGDLQTLKELTTSISGISPEQESFLLTLRTAVTTLLAKLSDLKNLSFYALRDDANVAATLAGLKIDLKYLAVLDSEATQSIVNLINGKLDVVVSKINDINAGIGKQNTRVKKLIQTNQDEINSFLTSAGYRYSVRIESSATSYRMLLEHQDLSGHIESAQEHLSYGEKNAFALVLFMHDVNYQKPDLVVLDDPVSSFDKTKKFAILHQLFRGSKSLNGTTTLLLTHDIEPAIDIVRTGTARLFASTDPMVHFLSGRQGSVVEKPIKSDDIGTFSQVCLSNIELATEAIIKCIYLRRYFEVHGALDASYDVLSSLLKARVAPMKRSPLGGLEPLSTPDLEAAYLTIRENIPDFDYAAVLADLRTPGFLKERFEATDVGYEKVQLFRIMLALDPENLKGDDVFTKFVNETYHIENEYVMQLNPRDFDAVPEFIVNACSKRLAGITS
jgi:energy-coupling factor transporter ATP-binding protein EcfA2